MPYIHASISHHYVQPFVVVVASVFGRLILNEVDMCSHSFVEQNKKEWIRDDDVDDDGMADVSNNMHLRPEHCRRAYNVKS